MPDQTTPSPLTPDEQLAEKITEAIGAAKLVNKEKLSRIREGLRKGSLSSADWKLLVELGTPAKAGDSQKP
jgi:hypothetical protein